MRLLLYGLNYAPEPVGIGRYSAGLAEWMAEQGHEVRVVTAPPYFPAWRAQGNRYRREQRQGVSVWRCPLWVPRRPGGLSRLLHLASFAVSSLPVLLAQRRWRPDLVVTVAPAFFCAPAALLLTAIAPGQCHSWLHIQDYELDAAFELGILRLRWLRKLAERWERSTLQRFERVSTISEAMRQRAISKGVATDRSALLPNWVDLEAIRPQSEQERENNPYRQELRIDASTLVLQYSGSMNRKQGLDLLVEVMKRFEGNDKLIWLLAGEGPTKAALSEATADLRNVRLLPLQPEERLNDWLNLADIHLLPQRKEAADLVLPSKLLGILASGRPVVAEAPVDSELGKIAEIGGRRVEPAHADRFAEAIRELTMSTETRHKKGQEGRAYAEKNLGRITALTEWTIQVDKMLES